MGDITIKAKQLKMAALVIVLVGAGFLMGGGDASTVSLTGSSTAPACQTFCGALPDMEYGFVETIDGVDNCFCMQEQKAYDFEEDTTLTFTRATNFGTITAASVEDSIPDEVRQQREQQLAQQQQLLQQLQQQQSGDTQTS